MPNLNNVNWTLFMIQVIVIVVSITLHEFGHAYSADRLGDSTPRREGRVNLWPDRHFDPLGFILILVTSLGIRAIGWGKPVRVNPNNFKHPRRDMAIVTACGPLMNLLLALVFGLILRIVLKVNPTQGFEWVDNAILGQFTLKFVELNLLLMFFNLIPIHPLDGGKLVSSVLPQSQATRFDNFFYQFGPVMIMVLVFSGGLGSILSEPMQTMFHLIVGISTFF